MFLNRLKKNIVSMANSAVSPVDALSNNENNKPMDVNRYATKKTVAQGMLDIALLTSNASQLKYILQAGEKQQFYMLLVTLTSASILLQIGVGAMFLIIGGLDLNKKSDRRPALILNDVILLMIFLITAINVVISGFGFESYRKIPSTDITTTTISTNIIN